MAIPSMPTSMVVMAPTHRTPLPLSLESLDVQVHQLAREAPRIAYDARMPAEEPSLGVGLGETHAAGTLGGDTLPFPIGSVWAPAVLRFAEPQPMPAEKIPLLQAFQEPTISHGPDLSAPPGS